MNKKLFALLLVTAFSLQLKAVDSDGDGKVEDLRNSTVLPKDTGAGVNNDDTGTSINESDNDADDKVDEAAGASSTSSADRGTDNGGETFVMPGANDGFMNGLLQRCLGKVWTRGSKDIEAILSYGAKSENYNKMNQAEKAAYFNAQDAQWGLRTSRALKATRILIVAAFAKIMKDVLNATEDDEDEDDVVAYTA